TYRGARLVEETSRGDRRTRHLEHRRDVPGAAASQATLSAHATPLRRAHSNRLASSSAAAPLSQALRKRSAAAVPRGVGWPASAAIASASCVSLSSSVV